MIETLHSFSIVALLELAAAAGVLAAWLLWPAETITEMMRRWQDRRETRRFNETVAAYRADAAEQIERMRCHD